MAAKKKKEKRGQRAIDEKKRLTVKIKMQKEARDKRARHREKLSKERQDSGNISPRALRRIKQMVELNRFWEKQRKYFCEKYGHPDPVVSDRSFVEKSFGSTNVDCDDSVASNTVSLALFDEKQILFACSGIAIKRVPTTSQQISIIVTSKRLVTEFQNKRNRDDRLKIKVLLPGEGNIHMDGFLGLYDKDIAIVTCFYFSDPRSVDMDSQVQQLSDHDSVVALGRAFSSGTLMPVKGQRVHVATTDDPERVLIYDCAITEAGIGGPVIDKDGHFLGLNIDCDTNTKRTSILPWQLVRERLHYIEKYRPNSSNYREHTLTEDLFSLVPSGHWNVVNYLTSMGYPKPPPLVLERDKRSFACTGYLIKWHKKSTTVIVTSASLIRSPVDEDKIDEKLKIDVFLPPNQHATGKLELYHLDYNIAVISVQKRLRGIHPENIFHTEKGRKKVAIGREVKDRVFSLSTCKIKKAGIGGPLVYFDGTYAGMNFYDGTRKTPYLPRRIIARVLSATDLPSQRRGMNHPVDMMGESAVKNRWPVPKPYWYHELFDVHRPLRGFVGRQLQ